MCIRDSSYRLVFVNPSVNKFMLDFSIYKRPLDLNTPIQIEIKHLLIYPKKRIRWASKNSSIFDCMLFSKIFCRFNGGFHSFHGKKSSQICSVWRDHNHGKEPPHSCDHSSWYWSRNKKKIGSHFLLPINFEEGNIFSFMASKNAILCVECVRIFIVFSDSPLHKSRQIC